MQDEQHHQNSGVVTHHQVQAATHYPPTIYGLSSYKGYNAKVHLEYKLWRTKNKMTYTTYNNSDTLETKQKIYLWKYKIGNTLLVKTNIPSNSDIVLTLWFFHHLQQHRFRKKKKKQKQKHYTRCEENIKQSETFLLREVPKVHVEEKKAKELYGMSCNGV